MSVASPGGTLVIGYGNPLRGDDGLGQVVAEAVEARRLPGVRALALHQLMPEVAAEMAGADVVIFVDASADPALQELEIEVVAPLESSGATTHFCRPASLLWLCEKIYQSAPNVLFIKAPAPIMGLGDTLSPVAERSVARCLDAITDIVAARAEGRTPGA